MRPFFYALYKAGYVTRSFYYKFCVLRDEEVETGAVFGPASPADRPPVQWVESVVRGSAVPNPGAGAGRPIIRSARV